MSQSCAEEPLSDNIVKDPQGRLFLKLVQGDSAEVIERLRETHADALGRAYLLRLDLLVERLGTKWKAKRDLVFDHMKSSFERKFQEPNWCIKINDDCFLAVILTLGEHKGALSAAELWYATGQFFVGDVSRARVPLYEAIAADVDRMQLIPIDLNTYFDRAEARPFVKVATPLPAAPEPLASRQPMAVGTMTKIQSSAPSGAVLTIGGRQLRIASSVEPVFEMKKLTMIGHRFEPSIVDVATNVGLDARALSTMDWGDREQIDVANIEQGVMLLQTRSPEQRKLVMIIPAAFSTFASAKARSRFMPLVLRAGQEMGLKVLFEVRNLNGVPPGRASEIASMLKPFCMTTMGHALAEPRAISALKGCGFAGACIDYDGARRDDAALESYLASLNTAARASTGACMIKGLDNLHQMAVARLAGVSHASVKSSALMTARR